MTRSARVFTIERLAPTRGSSFTFQFCAPAPSEKAVLGSIVLQCRRDISKPSHACPSRSRRWTQPCQTRRRLPDNPALPPSHLHTYGRDKIAQWRRLDRPPSYTNSPPPKDFAARPNHAHTCQPGLLALPDCLAQQIFCTKSPPSCGREARPGLRNRRLPD